MVNYWRLLNLYVIGITISCAVLWWGIEYTGWIRIVVSVITILLMMVSCLTELEHASIYKWWLRRNEGKVIVFYPAKKRIQNTIKKEFIQLLSVPVIEIYYEGPRLVGANNVVIKELMKWNSEVNIHDPCAIKIGKDELQIIQLNELKEVLIETPNYLSLVERLEAY